MSEIKRTLPDLIPGQRYVIRVRSKNRLGIMSDWSEALDYTPGGDGTVPSAPSGLVADFTSADLVLAWTAPTTNADGTELSDLYNYLITITAGEQSVTVESLSNYYQYTYAQNRSDFGTAQYSLDISVSAVDSSGNVSDAVSTSATNPAPEAPEAAPGLSSSGASITVVMDRPTNISDFSHYVLEGFTYPDASFDTIATTAASTVAHTGVIDSQSSFRYKYVDLFGRESDYSATGTITPTTPGGTGQEQVEDWVGGMVTGNTETGITVTYDDTAGKLNFVLDTETIQDIIGAMVSGNTETGIAVTYDDTGGKLDFIVSGSGTVAKYATSVGDGVATSYVVTHNLGSRDVAVSLTEVAAPYSQVFAFWEATSTNTITVYFDSAPTTNQYRVTVLS